MDEKAKETGKEAGSDWQWDSISKVPVKEQQERLKERLAQLMATDSLPDRGESFLDHFKSFHDSLLKAKTFLDLQMIFMFPNVNDFRVVKHPSPAQFHTLMTEWHVIWEERLNRRAFPTDQKALMKDALDGVFLAAKEKFDELERGKT